MELIFEKVFHFLFSVTNSYGWAILLISVLISVILMPFYHITNILEGREKAIRLKLQPYIARINKIKNASIKYKHLSKLYKAYNYSPIMSLRSLSSLVIQVPFFIVAYRALSKILIANSYNSDMSFLFIKNLGLQDNLIGGVNLLPILMTLINMLAVMCMTSFPKERKQSYTVAVFFLILLYMSPAGLVLYWTWNNIINLFRYLFIYLKGKKFSVIKNMLVNYLSHLLNSTDVRVFLFLIAVYFTINKVASVAVEYSNIITLAWLIVVLLKMYDYVKFLVNEGMSKRSQIQLLLVILCFIVSFFVKRWEKVHWLFAALTLLAMLFPAVLYIKSNMFYVVNNIDGLLYFSILIAFAAIVLIIIYFFNNRLSSNNVVKISTSFILAAMFLPLIKSLVGGGGLIVSD